MKFLKMMLKAADYAAMFIGIIAFSVLTGTAFLHALHELIWGTWRELADMWTDDRIVIWVVLGALGWCGFRWKQLNKP